MEKSTTKFKSLSKSGQEPLNEPLIEGQNHLIDGQNHLKSGLEPLNDGHFFKIRINSDSVGRVFIGYRGGG